MSPRPQTADDASFGWLHSNQSTVEMKFSSGMLIHPSIHPSIRPFIVVVVVVVVVHVVIHSSSCADGQCRRVCPAKSMHERNGWMVGEERRRRYLDGLKDGCVSQCTNPFSTVFYTRYSS